MDWEIELCEDPNGRIPVSEFLENLPANELAKAIWIIDLLEKTGIHLREPYVKHIEAALWELRSQNNRVLYFLNKRTFVLLHGFKKKTRTLPRVEKETAIRRMDEYLRRR